MGTDIHGWVEYQLSGPSPDVYMSCPVIRLGCLPSRDYDMFGCLFGVRNHALFKPIAAKRGIPIDVSYDLQQTLREIADADPRMRDEFHSYTWITWKEIKNIDWDEEAILADDSGRFGSWSFRRSFSPRKLSCLQCSYTRIWKGKARGGYGGLCDWYFRLPLWLQTSCCGKIL